jgi:Bacterial Ig domain
MPVIRRLLLALLAASLLAPSAATAADHPPLGAYTQLPGLDGCLGLEGVTTGCATAPGVGDSWSIEPSGDGRHVYVLTSGKSGGTLVGLTVDPATGALRAASPAICLSAWPNAGCAEVPELWRISAIALSPDGRHLYVASALGFDGPSLVTTWARDPAGGGLDRVPGADGCVTSGPATDGCRHVAGIDGVGDLAVSADGTSVYAVATAYDRDAGWLATLARDPAGGRLTQPSATGCLAEGAPLPAGCQAARGLAGAGEVVVSSDSRNVYVGGGTQSAGTIAVFARGAQGGLSQPAGTAGCIRGGAAPGDCAAGRGMNGALYTGFPAPLAISSDGATLYKGASGAGGGIAVFGRERATGALTQLPGGDGCVAPAGTPATTCGEATGVRAVWGLEVAPGGDAVLAFDYGGQGGGGHVAVLDRGATGAVTQRAAPYGCLGNVAEPQCLETTDLRSTAGGAFAPDGATVYVSGWDSDFATTPIVVLTREAAPVCEDGAASAVAGSAAELTLVCREPNGQPLTRAISVWPAHGSLRAVGDDGRFAYTPDAGFAGGDALVFRASDGAHWSAPARLALTVTAPPPGPDDRRQQPDDREVPRDGEPPAAPRLSLTSRGTLVADGRGRVRIALACAGDAARSCTASVTLQTARKVRSAPRARARVLALAAPRRVTARGGRRLTVVMTLSRQARTLLRRSRTLRAVVAAGGAQATVTLKAPARRR